MINPLDYEKFLKSRKINSYYHSQVSSKYIDGSSHHDVFTKLMNERVLILGGEMDDDLCELLKANLLYLDSINGDDIKMYINSGGGSVYAGLGLIDVMEYIKPDICTVNTGLAASMAAVVLCCGTKGKRKSLKRAQTMIHQPMSFVGFAQASDIEIDAKQTLYLKKELYDIISEKTGKSYEKVSRDSDRDYWMNAKSAKDYGIIDEIVSNKK